MWALGEMSAANPASGAFSVYAERALGKTAGATVGWLWWLQLVVVIAAEALGAAGLLFTVWPVVPVWALALVFMVAFTAINLTGVRNFGEFEFWFAILKVAAIVVFLAVGAALLLGILPDVASPGLANITTDFAPAGLGGIATALFVVIFAFGGNVLLACSFYVVQRTCKARLWGGSLPWFVFWGYNTFIILAGTGYLLGITEGHSTFDFVPPGRISQWLRGAGATVREQRLDAGRVHPHPLVVATRPRSST